jgi:hypothetical protein
MMISLLVGSNYPHHHANLAELSANPSNRAELSWTPRCKR